MAISFRRLTCRAGSFLTLALSVTILLSSLLSNARAADEEDRVAEPSGLREGYGESYWGFIPARSDSAAVAKEVQAKSRSAWEYPLLVPYQIIRIPIWLVTSAIGAGYIYLDESGFIYRLTQLFAPKPVPYGATLTVDAASLAGLGGGLVFFHDEFLGDNNRARLKMKVSRSLSHQVALGTFFNYGGDTSVEVGGGYREKTTSRYFGLGPRSSRDGKSFYTQETSWGGATLHQHLKNATHLELTALYSGVGARRSSAKSPALPDHYPPEDVPRGYGDLSTGSTFSLALIRNTTETNGRPEAGSIQRVKATYFSETDDERISFWSYRAEFENFIPALFTERALALRGYINWLDDQSENIPFQRLLTNDEPDQFRGYRDSRFRDRGITALSIEYRWPIWASRAVGETGLDCYVATDFGQVFNDFQQISRKNVSTSYVFGFRGVGASGFRWRAEVGWSKEEVVLQFTSDQIFQFIGESLFHGRETAALR